MILTTLKNWYRKVKTNCDPLELEQANIRLIIGVCVFLFFAYWELSSHATTTAELTVFKILFLFEVAATALFLAIINNKLTPKYRRIIGAWLDISAATALITVSAEAGALLIAINFWVIFGNGFRYGKNYLYHAQALALIGFILAITSIHSGSRIRSLPIALSSCL